MAEVNNHATYGCSIQNVTESFMRLSQGRKWSISPIKVLTMSIPTESYSVNDRESWILGNGYVQFGEGCGAVMPRGYSTCMFVVPIWLTTS